MRSKLQQAAYQIARNNHTVPVSSIVALRKLFVQEKRNRKVDGNPRIGWKRGELFEVMEALVRGGDWRSEWGDVGYYVAQTWDGLWFAYALVTPETIIERASKKFQGRAQRGKK